MYKCKQCKAVFNEPYEEKTTYESLYGVSSEFSDSTPLTISSCPYCGSERIKEYEEELEDE